MMNEKKKMEIDDMVRIVMITAAAAAIENTKRQYGMKY